MPIRILIADDHGLIRAGLRALLENVPEIQVVGEAADGVSIVKLVAELSTRHCANGYQHARDEWHRSHPQGQRNFARDTGIGDDGA